MAERIECADRMPPAEAGSGSSVDVLFVADGRVVMGFADLGSGDWSDDGDRIWTAAEVTYWQPLPEPPPGD